MSDATKSIIQAGVRAPCPLQIKSKPVSIMIEELSYDSDSTPMTTGPSTAACSTPSEFSGSEDNIELVYPEYNRSYFMYHHKTFSKLAIIDSSEAATLDVHEVIAQTPEIKISAPPTESAAGSLAREEDVDVADDPAVAEAIIKNNVLDDNLFAAVCPWNLNETSVFLYGRLATPHYLAELLANNPKYRVYEQAARMFPAELRGFTMATIGETSIKTVVPQEGSVVTGYVLFSTSIRERSLIKESRGDAFEQVDTEATVDVGGREVSVPVVTTQAVEKWMEHAMPI